VQQEKEVAQKLSAIKFMSEEIERDREEVERNRADVDEKIAELNIKTQEARIDLNTLETTKRELEEK
jgi:hypothetical protein